MYKALNCYFYIKFYGKNGIITRERVDYDARLKKNVSKIRAMEEMFLIGIDDEELKSFYKTLEKIKNNII